MFQRATGCSDEIASKVWVFDEEEKAALIPPTAAMLAKHGPSWLSTFDVEIEFCVIFFSLQMSKFMMMKTLLERERKNNRSNLPQPTPISQPIFTPESPSGPEEPELATGVSSKNDAEKPASDTIAPSVESLEEMDASNPPPPIQ
jgi:hypothetical protein